MSRRKDARVTYDVIFWPTPDSYKRVLESVNKRTASRAAKRLGVGSLVVKRLNLNNRTQLWRRQQISPQPAAPLLKNGRRMDSYSYNYHYLGCTKEGMDVSIVTPITEVA